MDIVYLHVVDFIRILDTVVRDLEIKEHVKRRAGIVARSRAGDFNAVEIRYDPIRRNHRAIGMKGTVKHRRREIGVGGFRNMAGDVRRVRAWTIMQRGMEAVRVLAIGLDDIDLDAWLSH